MHSWPLVYTMVYGIKLINFAHGDIYGRCLCRIFLIELMEMNFFCRLALAMVGTAILGLVNTAYHFSSFDSVAAITAIGGSFLLRIWSGLLRPGANTRPFRK